MKKLMFIPCLMAIITACSDSEYEMHLTQFVPLQSGGKVLYADQSADSTHVLSYDNWTAATSFTGDSWFRITPTTAVCNPLNGTLTRLDILTSPNTSGKNRAGQIQVTGYDRIGLTVTQVKWLNITDPSATYQSSDETGSSSGISYQEAVFRKQVAYSVPETTIVFEVYDEAGATLTSDASWLIPAETAFTKGKHEVTVTLQTDPNGQERKGTLTLTSGGVSTPITITQGSKLS
ncbi:MAG: BACON domain-containing protein [Alloprevotella sp.]